MTYLVSHLLQLQKKVFRKAFRQKALETHPDKLSPYLSEVEKHAAEARFHQIASAVDTLGDPLKRKSYDAGLQAKANFQLAQAQRTKERQEWARQQEEVHQARMKELRERNVQIKANLQNQVSAARQKEEVLRKLLADMDSLTPEWRLRKELAEKRKAARSQPSS
ncbi:hypothetical protein CPB85DRAFT_1428855 [Mucidula mucida]|nr:hypothetical protein CPB85DRAFT_1428855 [Mucidula mucida]